MQMPTSERLRVAQELHDGIAQDLVGVGYCLDLLFSNSSLSTEVRSQVRSARLGIDALIAKVRSEILQLRQNSSVPLTDRIKEVARLIAPSHEITFNFSEVDLNPILHEDILTIVSEILRNSVAHAGATHLGIHLYPVDNRTCLELFDNGIGGARVREGHFGISGIIEKVHSLQGSITIESIDGTRVAILM